jgi:very-short-patch-repair endonuclease
MFRNTFFRKRNRLGIGKESYSTPEARELGRLLKNYGWKVELEKWDGHKHIDIAITEAKVNIEVDGKQHNLSPKQALADLERTYYSFKKGYVTLRIPNVLVRDAATIEDTARFIDKFLRESDWQLDHSG